MLDILPTRGYTKSPVWSAEHDDRLRLMWAEGFSCKDIARELRRKIPGIHYRAAILDLPSRLRANAAKPKPAPVVAAVPVPVSTPPTALPPGLRYEDDPRATAEGNKWPTARRGDVTATMMGDPPSGRSAA